MSLYNLLQSRNKKIRDLVKEIQTEQRRCEHVFGAEWQTYNFYNKRCKKCGYVESKE